jgi:hypothetical protein
MSFTQKVEAFKKKKYLLHKTTYCSNYPLFVVVLYTYVSLRGSPEKMC